MTVAKEKWRERLRRAFAVDPPGPAEPTPQQQAAVDWVCRQIAKRHLTTPGLLALEMSRPLNYVGAQMLHVMQPAVWALASQQSYESYVHFSQFLEKRGSLEYMMRRIEALEQEYERSNEIASMTKHLRIKPNQRRNPMVKDESVNRLTHQFLAWLASNPRTYGETMDAWRTTCPRLTVWEDALKDGLIQIENSATMKQSRVTLTPRGREVLYATSS